MPTYQVTLLSVLRGILPFGKNYRFLQASERAVDSKADLRWGPNGKGFRRLLHPNGVCLTGLWQITEETEYSGYFRKGSQALAIGRYSTCCAETRRGHERSLSLVGKLFPTTDPNHHEPLRTANFITQQDIGGDHTDYINDAETRNAPDTSPWRRGSGLPILLITGAVFLRADKEPSICQLYQIAELGKQETSPRERRNSCVCSSRPNSPGYTVRPWIFATKSWHRFSTEAILYRNALSTFQIEVTDEGSTQGAMGFQRRTFRNWRPIGNLRFHDAALVLPHNGDYKSILTIDLARRPRRSIDSHSRQRA